MSEQEGHQGFSSATWMVLQCIPALNDVRYLLYVSALHQLHSSGTHRVSLFTQAASLWCLCGRTSKTSPQPVFRASCSVGAYPACQLSQKPSSPGFDSQLGKPAAPIGPHLRALRTGSPSERGLSSRVSLVSVINTELPLVQFLKTTRKLCFSSFIVISSTRANTILWTFMARSWGSKVLSISLIMIAVSWDVMDEGLFSSLWEY